MEKLPCQFLFNHGHQTFAEGLFCNEPLHHKKVMLPKNGKKWDAKCISRRKWWTALCEFKMWIYRTRCAVITLKSSFCQSVNMHLAPLCACVSPPVPPEDPIVDGSPELLLMAGNPYNLTCVTRGAKPAAHIQWNKDGIPVEGAYHSTVSTTTHIS